MSIQCGGSFTSFAPGSCFIRTFPSFSQWLPPLAMYAIPGTVLPGFGAPLMRSLTHCLTAASIHMGSGSGRFSTLGMQVNPLVPFLISTILPSSPGAITAASLAIWGGAPLRARAICSSLLMALTPLCVAGGFVSAPAMPTVRRPAQSRKTTVSRMKCFMIAPFCDGLS